MTGILNLRERREGGVSENGNGRKHITPFAGIVAFLAVSVTASAAYNFSRVEKKVDVQVEAHGALKLDHEVFKSTTVQWILAKQEADRVAATERSRQTRMLEALIRRQGLKAVE